MNTMVKDSEIIPAGADWLCPVCFCNTNSQGIPFFSSRAVALHVSGKIRSGDRSHRRCAVSKAGDIIDEPGVNRSINTLAERLQSYVSESNKMRWQQEEERIEHLVQKRMGKEDPRVVAYKYVKAIETSLHEFAQRILQVSFGAEESGWWVQGVPLNIRRECAQRCEEDKLREEKYKYTDLIDLEAIINKNWKEFEPYFHKDRKSPNSKKEFLIKIVQTNEVRKRVMHTIRSEVSTEEVFFLEQFSQEVGNFVQGMY